MAVRALLALGCAVIGLLVFHSAILRFVGRLLVVDQSQVIDPDWPTVVLLVSGDGNDGSGYRCYDFAADYSCGGKRPILLGVSPANRLIQIGAVAGFKSTATRQLTQRGIPPAAIVEFSADEVNPWFTARSISRWLASHSGDRVVMFCGRFDSRMWRYALDRTPGPGRERVRIVSLVGPYFDETNWWKQRSGIKSVFYAFVPLMYAILGERVPDAQWRWATPEDYERDFARSAGLSR